MLLPPLLRQPLGARAGERAQALGLLGFEVEPTDSGECVENRSTVLHQPAVEPLPGRQLLQSVLERSWAALVGIALEASDRVQGPTEVMGRVCLLPVEAPGDRTSEDVHRIPGHLARLLQRLGCAFDPGIADHLDGTAVAPHGLAEEPLRLNDGTLDILVAGRHVQPSSNPRATVAALSAARVARRVQVERIERAGARFSIIALEDQRGALMLLGYNAHLNRAVLGLQCASQSCRS
jgi:hypothetical protein